MKFLIKLNHLSAWILLLGLVFFFISGFGMTKGIINSQLALILHHDILPYVVFAAFIFHTFFGVRMALMRWRAWSSAARIILILVYAAFAALFIWADRFYVKDYGFSPNNASALQTILNLQEIARHNSARDCWLLMDDKIYDVTSFISLHPGGEGEIIKNCGKDATMAFNAKSSEQESHSEYAVNLLNSYFIGDLNQAIQQ